MPVTHHFYPLQRHTDPEVAPFSDFLRLLDSPKPQATDNMIYLHIPYCEKRCTFCPFHVRVKRDVSVYERYVVALEREIEMLARRPYVQDMKFRAVYFGGGSPSLLTVDQIKRLYDALRRSFAIEPDAEWTFEGEPTGLCNPELLEYLASQGTKRLSYGIQTFDEPLRMTMNIAATVQDALTCNERAKALGFEDINVDMMYYMPGQTLAAVERDLKELGNCGFDSVDYYYMSYYAMPKSAFLGMEKGTYPRKPPAEMRGEMGLHVQRRMRELGYHHVTDHVYSKRPEGSEYYRILWGGGFGEHRAETLAIGASARGYLGGYSYANTLAPDPYVEQIEAGNLPVNKVSALLEDPRNRGMVFFPKFFRTDLSRIPDDAKTRVFLDNLVEQGYAVIADGQLSLTDKGKEWIPNITVDLFEDPQREIHDAWVEELDSHYSNRVTL
ncbi:coproporphyrinogen-III oxidase family protein [Streptomyces olivaceus]